MRTLQRILFSNDRNTPTEPSNGSNNRSNLNRNSFIETMESRFALSANGLCSLAADSVDNFAMTDAHYVSGLGHEDPIANQLGHLLDEKTNEGSSIWDDTDIVHLAPHTDAALVECDLVGDEAALMALLDDLANLDGKGTDANGFFDIFLDLNPANGFFDVFTELTSKNDFFDIFTELTVGAGAGDDSIIDVGDLPDGMVAGAAIIDVGDLPDGFASSPLGTMGFASSPLGGVGIIDVGDLPDGIIDVGDLPDGIIDVGDLPDGIAHGDSIIDVGWPDAQQSIIDVGDLPDGLKVLIVGRQNNGSSIQCTCDTSIELSDNGAGFASSSLGDGIIDVGDLPDGIAADHGHVSSIASDQTNGAIYVLIPLSV